MNMKLRNNTHTLTLIFAAILLIPIASNAANQPCSGKKGGIASCDGAKFVCVDGSISKSQKDCSAEFGGGNATPSKTSTAPVQPITSVDKSTPAVNNAVNGLPATIIERTGNILKLGYQGFTVWLDCEKRGAVKFMYNAQHDTGNAKRSDTFYLDPNVPSECQQTTAKAYGNKYDRGHQVPANHLDSSDVSIRETNYMTNIMPQAANMNRGAWLQTEEIIECYRDQDELLVIGGVIWGNNAADDYFVQSHGVKTPDAYWKVIIRGTGQDERAIAWIVPNTQDATRKNLDKYLVTVDEIERVTGEKIPVADMPSTTNQAHHG
jgi:endonuclease G, mitochondrial